MRKNRTYVVIPVVPFLIAFLLSTGAANRTPEALLENGLTVSHVIRNTHNALSSFVLALQERVRTPVVKAHYHRDGPAELPDPVATPGAVLPVSMAQICRPGYAGKTRNVPEKEKRAVYAEYGAREQKGVCCEVDHLISLELGGSNSIQNLWPQPYVPTPGAHEKDRLEARLHALVCDGQLPLTQAQKEIRTDWYRSYLRRVK